MPTDDYQNYIKHLESILRMYEVAATDIGLIDSDAQGVLARAEAAINKICGEASAYTARMRAILDGSYSDSYRADLIIGIVRA